MNHRITVLVLIFCCLGTCPGRLFAQGFADVLGLERRSDTGERDLLAQRLAKLRVTLAFKDAGPDQVAKVLNAYCEDLTMFVVRPHKAARDWASLNLELSKRPLLQVLALIERVSTMRFVFRSGVILLMHEGDEQPPLYLAIYDCRMATRRLPDFPAPRLDLPHGEGRGEEPESGEGRSASGMGPERLEELIRANVRPESWGETASLTQSQGIFIVRQTERGHRELARLLRALGVRVPLRRSYRVKKTLPQPKKRRPKKQRPETIHPMKRLKKQPKKLGNKRSG